MSFHTKFIPLAKPYGYKIKDTIFLVSSFGNQKTSVCAEDMLFDIIQRKIKNKNQ